MAEPISIVPCSKCRVFNNVLRMFFSGGHLYCEKDKPEDAVRVGEVFDSVKYVTRGSKLGKAITTLLE